MVAWAVLRRWAWRRAAGEASVEASPRAATCVSRRTSVGAGRGTRVVGRPAAEIVRSLDCLYGVGVAGPASGSVAPVAVGLAAASAWALAGEPRSATPPRTRRAEACEAARCSLGKSWLWVRVASDAVPASFLANCCRALVPVPSGSRDDRWLREGALLTLFVAALLAVSDMARGAAAGRPAALATTTEAEGEAGVVETTLALAPGPANGAVEEEVGAAEATPGLGDLAVGAVGQEVDFAVTIAARIAWLPAGSCGEAAASRRAGSGVGLGKPIVGAAGPVAQRRRVG